MTIARSVCLAGAALSCAAILLSSAGAQPAPRVKARLVSFDGQTLTLQPLAPLPAGQAPPSDAKPMTVAVLPETRYVATEKAAFADLKPGIFAGALVSAAADGKLEAKELQAYPEALKGAGEGRFPDAGAVRINGIVMTVQADQFTLHYRGATQNGATCEGRATPAPFASPLSCSGDAVIHVGAQVPVTALVVGDKSLLLPGALVTVSLAKNSQGDAVTPGIIVEKPQSPP